MEPPTSTAPKKLKIRAYDCVLSTRKTREKLDKLVATAPVFNESWVTGDLFMTARIGGMQQYGDILVQQHPPASGGCSSTAISWSSMSRNAPGTS